MGQLEGKVALVTGAASGIGLACAKRFAAEGASIAALDVGECPGDVWKEIEERAPGAIRLRVDVAAEAEVEGAIGETISKLGRIDVVLNAAGVGGGGPAHTVPEEEWDRVVDINLKGTFLVCKHALVQMLERRSGSIVNIASIEGLEGFEAASAYNASKGGVVVFTKNLAIDYARVGIRANSICPGFIDTPLMKSVFANELPGGVRERMVDAHQLGRVGRPDEVAAAALFLASDEASFVTGHALVVDGGWMAGRRVGISPLFGLE